MSYCSGVWFVVAGCSNGWDTTESLDEGAINPLKMATNHDFQKKSKIANTYTVACFSIFDVHIVKNVSQSIDTPPFFWCNEQWLLNISLQYAPTKIATGLNFFCRPSIFAHLTPLLRYEPSKNSWFSFLNFEFLSCLVKILGKRSFSLKPSKLGTT